MAHCSFCARLLDETWTCSCDKPLGAFKLSSRPFVWRAAKCLLAVSTFVIDQAAESFARFSFVTASILSKADSGAPSPGWSLACGAPFADLWTAAAASSLMLLALTFSPVTPWNRLFPPRRPVLLYVTCIFSLRSCIYCIQAEILAISPIQIFSEEW